MSEGTLSNFPKPPIEVPPHEFPRNVINEGMGIALNDLSRSDLPNLPIAIMALPSEQTYRFDMPESGRVSHDDAVEHEEDTLRGRRLAASFKVYMKGDGPDRTYSLESGGVNKSGDPEDKVVLKAGDELPIGRAQGWWLPAGVSKDRDNATRISFHQGIMKVDENGRLYYHNLGRNPASIPNREEVRTFRIRDFEESDKTVPLKIATARIGKNDTDTAPIKIIASQPPEQDDPTIGLNVEAMSAPAHDPDLTQALGRLAHGFSAGKNSQENDYSMNSAPDNSPATNKKSPPQYGGDKYLSDNQIKTP